MPISLKKGENTNLSQMAPSMTKMLIGLGWDARATNGADFDLDAWAFLLTEDEKVRSDSDLIFYNQKSSSDGSVVYAGDNRTGDGHGDDEEIIVDLSKLTVDVAKIAVSVTIHEAQSRGQNFGQVKNAFIRCVDAVSGEEHARFDLSEDFSIETAVVFGLIYRHSGSWKFKAVGQGYSGGIEQMCSVYGINI